MNTLEWFYLVYVAQLVYSFSSGSILSVFSLMDHNGIKSSTMIYAPTFASLVAVFNIIRHYHFEAMGDHLIKTFQDRISSIKLAFDFKLGGWSQWKWSLHAWKLDDFQLSSHVVLQVKDRSWNLDDVHLCKTILYRLLINFINNH